MQSRTLSGRKDQGHNGHAVSLAVVNNTNDNVCVDAIFSAVFGVKKVSVRKYSSSVESLKRPTQKTHPPACLMLDDSVLPHQHKEGV